MSKASVKTLRFKLRDLTNRKRRKIDEFMDKVNYVQRETSKRMAGIPRYVWGKKTSNIWATSVIRDFTKREELDMQYMVINEAVQAVRSSFESWRQNGYEGNAPTFDKVDKIIYRRCPQVFRFGRYEDSGQFYVNVPFNKGRGGREFLPIEEGKYHDKFMEKFVDGELNPKLLELIKKGDNDYWIHISIQEDIDGLDYEPKTFIGVDVGVNILAWAVAFEEDEWSFLDEIHFSGKEMSHMVNIYEEKRAELQESGNFDLVKKIGEKVSRSKDNKNHVISRRIVEMSKKFEDPIIVLEDIDGDQIRSKAQNPVIDKWRFADLREKIQYKALSEGILTELVDPRDTSKTCSKCGYVSDSNRDGVDFECGECGYTNHSDFNAAVNIARRGFSS